jgi:hypothetical protein
MRIVEAEKSLLFGAGVDMDHAGRAENVSPMGRAFKNVDLVARAWRARARGPLLARRSPVSDSP